MNCSKCNKPMKEYLGLKETGWDCVNPNCGKKIVNISEITVPDGNKAINEALEKAFSNLISGGIDDDDAYDSALRVAAVKRVIAQYDLRRYFDESDDDFRFRIEAHLDT